MTFSRRGEGKPCPLIFKNASGQEVTCPLGPRVFWGGGHSLHILLKLDTAQPESLKQLPPLVEVAAGACIWQQIPIKLEKVLVGGTAGPQWRAHPLIYHWLPSASILSVWVLLQPGAPDCRQPHWFVSGSDISASAAATSDKPGDKMNG